jgi:hypothetical protein
MAINSSTRTCRCPLSIIPITECGHFSRAARSRWDTSGRKPSRASLIAFAMAFAAGLCSERDEFDKVALRLSERLLLRHNLRA